jgi:SAM-dependent methyltransferase
MVVRRRLFRPPTIRVTDSAGDVTEMGVLSGRRTPNFSPANERTRDRFLDALPQRLTRPIPPPGHHESRSRDWDAASAHLAARALQAGEPTAWFEQLYAAGERDEIDMPWNRTEPHPLLAQWLPTVGPGDGRSAVVVGCGLGADAEFVAAQGYVTTAFDISATAIRAATTRYPHSPVRYRTADLFALPEEWERAFDLVIEIITIQALPVSLRDQAVAAVAALVAPGGTAMVVENIRGDDEPQANRPPWPFSRADIDSFTAHGLQRVAATQHAGGVSRWQAVFIPY